MLRHGVVQLARARLDEAKIRGLVAMQRGNEDVKNQVIDIDRDVKIAQEETVDCCHHFFVAILTNDAKSRSVLMHRCFLTFHMELYVCSEAY